jgi:hypothetical protein
MILRSLTLLMLFLPAIAVQGGNPAKSFYKRKAQATRPEAFARAERRLQHVKLGMTQRQFFAVMEMEVLAFDGEPKDARVDGYLGPAPEELGEPGDEGARVLAFGFEQDGRPQYRYLVLFRADQVSAVRALSSTVAQADPPRVEPP